MTGKQMDFSDKILIAKLLEKNHYKEAHDFLDAIWVSQEDPPQEVSGMLFILDIEMTKRGMKK